MQNEDVIKKQPNEKFPNIVQAILLILAYLVLTLVLSFMIHFAFRPLDPNLHRQPLFFPIMSIIAVAIIAKYVSHKTGLKLPELLPLGRFNLALMSMAFITLVGIHFLVISIFWGISELVPFLKNILSEFHPSYLKTAHISLWGVILNLLILEPIMEEIFFRGIILRGLFENYNINKAIVITAIISTLGHLGIVYLFSSFVAAIFLGYVYAKSKSLKSCIILHSLINLFPVTMLIIQIKTNLLRNDIVLNKNVPLLFIAAIYGVGLLLAVIGIKLFINKYRQPA